MKTMRWWHSTTSTRRRRRTSSSCRGEHIASLNDLTPAHDQIVGEVVRRAAALAAERHIAVGGFRTVFNTNRDAGQTVFHIHLHLIGGRSLGWPPG